MATNKEIAQKAENLMQNAILAEARKSIDYVYDTLNSEPNNTIPEEIFVNQFLPMFTGEKPSNSKDNTLTLWVGIAGNASNEVDVVNKQGEVLFAVPGLINTNLLKIGSRSRDESLTADVASYSQINKIMPRVAERELMDKLDVRLETMSSSIGVIESRWTEILSRYGKLPEVEKKKKEVISKESDAHDDMSYE